MESNNEEQETPPEDAPPVEVPDTTPEDAPAIELPSSDSEGNNDRPVEVPPPDATPV